MRGMSYVFRMSLPDWCVRTFALATLLLLAACSDGSISGPVNIALIQNTGHCSYQIAPLPVTTLTNINTLKGAVGQIATTDEVLDSDPEILGSFKGMHPVDTDWTKSDGVYYPGDFQTLFSASLYQAVEATYMLTLAEGRDADLLQLNPNLPQTRIIYKARSEERRVGKEC